MKKLFIEFKYMEDIKTSAKRMLELAESEQCIVEGIFNGILLTTENMNSIDDILKQREFIINKKIDKYKKSKKYIRKQELEKQKIVLIDQKTKTLLEEFNNLDLGNITNILLWFNKIMPIKNELNINYFEILNKLYEVGYVPLNKFLKNNDYDKSNEMKTVIEYLNNSDNLEESGVYLLSRIMQDIEDFGSIQTKEGIFTKIYCNKIIHTKSNSHLKSLQ